jgi:dTDP-4-dehydrorhamnose reductase
MVALLGATGYIGQEFKKQLEELGIETLCISRSEYDYYDLDTLRSILQERRPEFLINCAGYTGKPNVDACEDNQEETMRGNVTLVHNITKACLMNGVPWGHVSSGCIYTGSNGANGFTELDTPNFSFDTMRCSYYSGTKAQAEQIIKSLGSQVYTWRLRIPFDEYDNPRNYLSKLLRYPRILGANNSISHKGDFVKYCLTLWQTKADYGIYNVVNTNPVTTEQVTKKINDILGINKEFVFFENENQMYNSGVARTPRSNCVLDNTKLRKAIHPKRVRSSIKAVEASLKAWKVLEQDKDENGILRSYWQ